MLNKSDKYDFAMNLILGHSSDIIGTAITNAYASVRRTFRFKGRNHSESIDYVHMRIRTFVNSVRSIIETLEANYPVASQSPYIPDLQESYDSIFDRACNDIIQIFKEDNFECHYGQAQKWLNITMKHLVLYDFYYDRITPYLHVPIDNIIYNAMEEVFNIPKIDTPWSRMNKDNYWEYQLKIRDAIYNKFGRSIFPFEWEWTNWSLYFNR